MKHLKKFNENEYPRVYTSSYPTTKEIEEASPEQIMKWQRFLPSPSNESERESINLIFKKYLELKDTGDINSNTSKSVGWNENLTQNEYLNDLSDINEGLSHQEDKTALQELLEYVQIREESDSDLDIMFIKHKIKELLAKEHDQICDAYNRGYNVCKEELSGGSFKAPDNCPSWLKDI